MTPKPKKARALTTPSQQSNKKVKTTSNASILNFFRKAETTPLFVEAEATINDSHPKQLSGSTLDLADASLGDGHDEDNSLFEAKVTDVISTVDRRSSLNNSSPLDVAHVYASHDPRRLPFEEVEDDDDDMCGSEMALPEPPPEHRKDEPSQSLGVINESYEDLFEEDEDKLLEDNLELNSITCPVCSTDLSKYDNQSANSHVNACLDGSADGEDWAPTKVKSETLDVTETQVQISNKTGFSKIMAANAETTAWRNAEKTESAERGKPAAARNCPFYKKLYNGIITMDAFRYSAVPGCSAYFLSHFHSDHYMGLSGSWTHGPIYCSSVTANLVKKKLRVRDEFVVAMPWEEDVLVPGTGGIRVRLISANHCPGSAIFLFTNTSGKRILHCGDFRACASMLRHCEISRRKIDEVYLDTTYLNPKYCFPPQREVVDACAQLCVSLSEGDTSSETHNPFTMVNNQSKGHKSKSRLLVVIGTYSIGKERVCVGIAKALKTKIFASKTKRDICACLEDAELEGLLTSNPDEGQVHMTTLRDTSIEALRDYLKECKGSFGRIVGFKPTGWNYRPPSSRTDSPSVETVLNAPTWRSSITSSTLSPSKGSNRDVALYPVPYSEHSSFRELTCFCCGLDIGKVIPTVNIQSEASRAKMTKWISRWEEHKTKSGLYRISDGEEF